MRRRCAWTASPRFWTLALPLVELPPLEQVTKAEGRAAAASTTARGSHRGSEGWPAVAWGEEE